MNDLRGDVLYPSTTGPWPGRWLDHDGNSVFGLFEPSTRHVRIVEPQHDRVLRRLVEWLGCGELVSYRPERRAVIRVGAGERASYVKISRPKSATRLVQRIRAVNAARGMARGWFPHSPSLLWSDCANGVVVTDALPGAALHAAPERALRRVASALVAWQSAAVVDIPEVRTLPQVTERTPEQWASLVGRIDPVAEDTLLEAARRLPPMRSNSISLVHGDLHDRNVIVGESGIGIIDLDGVGVGSPAVDPGNLAAHFVLRSMQAIGDPAPGQGTAEAFIDAYMAAGGSAGCDDVTAAMVQTLHRLACVYAVRPRWPGLSNRLVRLI